MLEIAFPPLYRLAARARDETLGEPTAARRDATLVAIVFSIIAFEAALNDLAAVCALPGFKRGRAKIAKCAQVLRELDERQEAAVLKVSMLFAILSRAKLDKGARPWQDLDALIKLRNLIVHRRAEKGVMFWGLGVTSRRWG